MVPAAVREATADRLSRPESYFHPYASHPMEELLALANQVWDEINLPNLTQNILPTRFRADLILEKGECHFVRRSPYPEDLMSSALLTQINRFYGGWNCFFQYICIYCAYNNDI